MQTSTTKPRPALVSGDEQDVMTGWRRVMCWCSRAGATARIKRFYRRRERSLNKAELRKLTEEAHA